MRLILSCFPILIIFLLQNTLVAQKLDLDFGDEGLLKLDVPNVTAVNDIDGQLLVRNWEKIQSFDHQGNKNGDFGINSILDNPFGSELAVIIKSFMFDDKFTLLGIVDNGELMDDIALIQIDSETGDSYTEFNLSYSGGMLSERFVNYEVTGENLFLYGFESDIQDFLFPRYNALFASVDIEGNVVNPVNEFVILEEASDYNLHYQNTLMLENGKRIHFLQSRFPEGFINDYYLITDEGKSIADVDLADELINIENFYNKGITNSVQLNDHQVLKIGNTSYYEPMFRNAVLLDIETANAELLSFEELPLEYRIGDVLIQNSKNILVVGDSEASNRMIVCSYDENLELNEGFGSNGCFSFDLEQILIDYQKGFVQENNLYLYLKDQSSISTFTDLLVRINLDKLSSKKINPMADETIIVSPNPNSGKLVINIPEGKIAKHLEVVDLSGNILKTEEYQHELDIENLRDGIYLLKFTFEDLSVQTVRLIKEQ